uniref:glycosyltransferase family 4 protein n=1 Tax=Mariniflexile sp. TaxID=1979402 RepID=UPI0040487377
MKIAYCIGSLYKKGGTEKVLSNKANYFVDKLNYKIHIITEDQRDLPLGYNFDERIIFHDIAISKFNKKNTIKGLTFINNILKLRKLYSNLIKTIKPDVIVVCERGYLDYVIPYINKEIPKIREFHFSKEAVKVHASLMRPWFKRIKHELLYSVIFNSFNKYDYLALLTKRDKINGGYKTNLEVIPNMISESLPKKSANLSNKRVISVGSMYDKRKRFDVQIKLWKEVVKYYPDWVLDIYGDGAEKKNLEKLILELHLSNNVILHGNSNTMHEHYLDSSIFIFTSMAEGLPMVLIEALSYGIPIVSFDCPTGPSDIITNNQDGFIIPQGNIKMLKEKLFILIKDEELRSNMGKKARKNAERFTPFEISKLWINLFEKIIIKNES